MDKGVIMQTDGLKIQLTLVFPGGQTSVGDHAHVQPLLQPQPVHHAHDLHDERVLPQAVSGLEEHNRWVTGAHW